MRLQCSVHIPASTVKNFAVCHGTWYEYYAIGIYPKAMCAQIPVE
jgi:hypothetical protein